MGVRGETHRGVSNEVGHIVDGNRRVSNEVGRTDN